jgi:hypothetical protein
MGNRDGRTDIPSDAQECKDRGTEQQAMETRTDGGHEKKSHGHKTIGGGRGRASLSARD